MPNTSKQPEITEAAFVEIYKDTSIPLGETNRTITLQTALDMEDKFCPADDAARQDPNKRLQRLASMVGENLLPEHAYLIAQEVNPQG